MHNSFVHYGYGNAQAVTPTTLEVPKTSLRTSMFPSCCGLKIIHKLACLGKGDALSEKHAEAFDELVNTGKAQDGNWNTYGKALDTIAIITTSNRYNKPEEFEKQKKFFEKKKWKLLASWKSEESGGVNYMYGSPGIKAGGRK